MHKYQSSEHGLRKNTKELTMVIGLSEHYNK